MRKLLIGVATVALISITVNVLQAFRVHSIERQIETNQSINTDIIGLDIAEIRATDLGGRPATVRLSGSGRPTVLYVFRPSCPWCYRSADAFKSLARQAGARYNLVGLSLDTRGLRFYVDQQEMAAIPIYSGVDAVAAREFQLGHTPETIVVSPEGVIVRDWQGAYLAGIGSAVQRFFEVTLPPVDGAEVAWRALHPAQGRQEALAAALSPAKLTGFSRLYAGPWHSSTRFLKFVDVY